MNQTLLGGNVYKGSAVSAKTDTILLLTEMHQNVQPDDTGVLRHVFVFHLAFVNHSFTWREDPVVPSRGRA